MELIKTGLLFLAAVLAEELQCFFARRIMLRLLSLSLLFLITRQLKRGRLVFMNLQKASTFLCLSFMAALMLMFHAARVLIFPKFCSLSMSCCSLTELITAIQTRIILP